MKQLEAKALTWVHIHTVLLIDCQNKRPQGWWLTFSYTLGLDVQDEDADSLISWDASLLNPEMAIFSMFVRTCHLLIKTPLRLDEVHANGLTVLWSSPQTLPVWSTISGSGHCKFRLSHRQEKSFNTWKEIIFLLRQVEIKKKFKPKAVWSLWALAQNSNAWLKAPQPLQTAPEGPLNH